MSDDDLKRLRDLAARGGDYPCAPTDMIHLADEALARGAALECMRDEAAREYNHLRERVTQLETALRRAHACATMDANGECEGCFVSAALAAEKPA